MIIIATTFPVLRMLNEKIDVLSLSAEEQKLYETRMKLKSDIATIAEVQFKAGAEWELNEGKSLGFVEGISRGSRKKALETAWLMRQRNYPSAEICLMTGRSQEEVEGLN